VLAGRYPFQAESEGYIVDDVGTKLELQASHTLLEVGCGAGAVLGPLTQRVRHSTGIDHPSFERALEARGLGNLTFVSGRWPSVTLREKFDRVLVYSVLHYLPTAEHAFEFVDACVDRLAPDGRLLLGDLPNQSARRRFTATTWGKQFSGRWRERVHASEDADQLAELGELGDQLVPFIDDRFVLELLARYRSRGLEAWVLPQPAELPFGNTREDVLVWRRPE
jgi:cyclopropane fatty-acyl-phospholipid synthase-like methyltransferase